MDRITLEKYVLRLAVVALMCVAAAQTVRTRGQTQPLPGPGKGVVDVAVVNEVKALATQAGPWRVAAGQDGMWKVGVQGTVTTAPVAPDFLRVGGTYSFQWAEHWAEVGTVREIHPSGWVRIDSPGRSRGRWLNPAQATSIDVR